MTHSVPQTIYVAGHRGMVGSAIARALRAKGMPSHNIITRAHAELDLCNQAAVQAFFAAEKPTQVYLTAAKVGRVHANNTYPADFIYQSWARCLRLCSMRWWRTIEGRQASSTAEITWP